MASRLTIEAASLLVCAILSGLASFLFRRAPARAALRREQTYKLLTLVTRIKSDIGRNAYFARLSMRRSGGKSERGEYHVGLCHQDLQLRIDARLAEFAMHTNGVAQP
jgi:hypothetical protein